VTKKFAAAFAVAAGLVTSAAAQNKPEPYYHNGFRAEDMQTGLLIHACGDKGQLVETALLLGAPWENIDDRFRALGNAPARAHGQPAHEYYMNITERERAESLGIVHAEITARMQKNTATLTNGLDQLTEIQSMDVEAEIPQLQANIAATAKAVARESGWPEVSTAVFGGKVTPNSAACANGPSMTFGKLNY